MRSKAIAAHSFFAQNGLYLAGDRFVQFDNPSQEQQLIPDSLGHKVFYNQCLYPLDIGFNLVLLLLVC